MGKSTPVGQESCGMLREEVSFGMASAAWSIGYFADSERVNQERHDDAGQSRIAELAGALVGGAAIEDLLTKVASASVALVRGADLAKISVIDNGELRSIATTSQLTALLDSAQRMSGQGPCLEAISAHKAVRCDDL